MIDSRSVSALVRVLEDIADGELSKSRELVLHLLDLTPSPFSRGQFAPGHITCTGLVVAPDANEILVVHHRRLDRWLPPGGHVDPEDARIGDVARREVLEETGVPLEDQPEPRLIGIDVHGIPPGRGEPYHLHHDLLFAFRALSRDARLSHECRAIAWCAPAEFARFALPANVLRAVIRLNA